MNIQKLILLFLFIFSFLFFNSVYATTGNKDYGYGVISKSMGGTGVAYPAETLVLAVNPAGIAFLNHRIDAGAELFNPYRGYSATDVSTPFGVAPGKQTSRQPYFIIPHLGYVLPLFSYQGAIGLALYANGGMNTSYKSDFSGSTIGPGSGVYGGEAAGVDLKQFFINLGVAWKFYPNLSVGLSIIPAIQDTSIQGFLPFQPFSVSPTNLSNRGDQYTIGVGYRGGALYRYSTWLSFGAAYQPKIHMGKQSRYKGAFPNWGTLNIPASSTAGLSFNPLDSLVLNFDAEKIWYSGEPSYSNHNVCSLTGGACLGSKNGSGFGWHNTVAYKIGGQWTANSDLILRAGYNHSLAVISSDQLLFNIVSTATVRHHYTAGFTYAINRCLYVNTNFMYAPKVSITGKNGFNPAQDIQIFLREYEVGASVTWNIDA